MDANKKLINVILSITKDLKQQYPYTFNILRYTQDEVILVFLFYLRPFALICGLKNLLKYRRLNPEVYRDRIMVRRRNLSNLMV